MKPFVERKRRADALMVEDAKAVKCFACNGRGYLFCACWPGDCICGYGDETCDECNGDGYFYDDGVWDDR